MDFMETRRGVSPSRPRREVEPRGRGRTIWTKFLTARSGSWPTAGCSDEPEKESFRKVLDSIRVIRADGRIVGVGAASRRPQEMICGSCSSTHGTNARGRGYARKVVNSAKDRDFGVREARDAERRPEESGFVSSVSVAWV